MKLNKILLTALVTLTFTTTVNADEYKMNTCVIAETAFWDIHKKPYDRSNYTFLNTEDKINQIQLAKADLELAMDNVINKCSKVDKDIKSQYEKLKADLLKELIKEQDY